MTDRKIPCPSCRTEITVTPEGDPLNPEVGHFHVGGDDQKKPDDVPAPAAGPDAAIATPATPSNGAGSFWDRASANLSRTLKG